MAARGVTQGVFRVVVLLVLVLVVLSCSATTAAPTKGAAFAQRWEWLFVPRHPTAGGLALQPGIGCAACTMIVGLLEQVSQVQNQTVEQTMQEACSYLPDIMLDYCQFFVQTYGPDIVVLLEDEETADVACQQISMCSNKTCHLFPAPLKSAPPMTSARAIQRERRAMEVRKKLMSQYELKNAHDTRWDPWTWLIQLITQAINSHEAIFDIDGDLFSNMEVLRGSLWRGKDCDDSRADVYPGRSKSAYPPDIDHNCNGIAGTDSSGRSYEDLFCAGTQQYGTIVLGDSAGAHFHVPPDYITAAKLNKTTYSSLIDILSMEFDWPEMSSGTGFQGMNWTGAPEGIVRSGYLEMVSRNLCMHRDFQNVCVNGARSSSMASTIVKTMARNQTLDVPAIVTFALIGNDVCNGHAGVEHMTTPQEFETNVMASLTYLEAHLPAKSHVIFVGLVDGRVLYESMANRIHPIGSWHNDVTYANFYDFLNCLEISPCWGWMNSNATARNATTQRAFELNQVYKQIIANTTFTKFDMHYFDPPLAGVLKQWEQQGGQAWQLIEPVDGFHPNQIANYLFANYQNALYEKYYPNLLPPINPNNVAIQKIFGNQGGY